MTYQEAITAARSATTYDEADAVCKAIEDEDSISDQQYYIIKDIAINAAYAAISAN